MAKVIIRNLPVLIGNPEDSLGLYSDPHCHSWQRGHHIDTLPRDPTQEYDKKAADYPVGVDWMEYAFRPRK